MTKRKEIEEEFDKKYVIPEDHFGTDYWRGNYRKQIWGKYQNGDDIKSDLITTLKSTLLELEGEVEGLKVYRHPDDIEKGLEISDTGACYNQAVSDSLDIIRNKLKELE